MRKTGIVVTAIACLTLVAFAAQAATAPVSGPAKGQMTFGLQGGIVMPMGKLAAEFTEDAESGFNGKMGFGGGISFDYFIVDNFAIGLDGGYSTLGSDEAGFEDIKATTMNFGLHGKYVVPTGGPMMPYLFAGGGMYSAKITDIPLTEDLSQSKIGLNGGVGLEYKVSEMVGIGVNGAYHMALGKFEPEIDGTKQEVFKDWNYIAFNAAVTFYLPMAK